MTMDMRIKALLCPYLFEGLLPAILPIAFDMVRGAFEAPMQGVEAFLDTHPPLCDEVFASSYNVISSCTVLYYQSAVALASGDNRWCPS